MTDKPKVSYKRAPSKELLELLVGDGDLSWLIDLGKEKIAGYHHDVHFRGKEIHVYRDGARVVKAEWFTSLKKVDVSADKKYMNETCVEGFFGRHEVGDTLSGGFKDKLKCYLDKVDIASNQKGKEGAVQTKWSRLEMCPWTPLDRECRLSHQSMTYKEEVEERIAKDVDGALRELKKIYRDHDNLKGAARWAKPAIAGGQIDQLAVDDEGRLVLLELKDGSKNNKEIYYAPFQLLQYVWRWHNALQESPSLLCDLQELIRARQQVCLISSDVLDLTGCIKPAIGFGCDIPTAETKNRYKKVLEIVNCYLPPDVPHIETWAWKDGRPCKLDW